MPDNNNETRSTETIRQQEENKLKPRSINKQREGLFERTISDDGRNQNR